MAGLRKKKKSERGREFKLPLEGSDELCYAFNKCIFPVD